MQSSAGKLALLAYYYASALGSVTYRAYLQCLQSCGERAGPGGSELWYLAPNRMELLYCCSCFRSKLAALCIGSSFVSL